MNKQELIARMAEKAGIPRKDADKALAAFTAAVTEELAAGGKVALPGFGAFEVKTRAAREGRNPRTGEKTSIPEKKLPTFKAGAKLKSAVEG